MHAFLLVGPSKEDQEKEAARILRPLTIDAVDITRISPQHTIGIANIRMLKRRIALKPFKSKTKAVIIEDAQTLTIEAQNALLKTLEEPPNNTIIILLTTNTGVLLPTIVSRCQVIQLLTTNNIQLTDKELEVSSKQLAVITGEIGERLQLAQEATKDRESATFWLGKMILAARQNLIDEVFNTQESRLISQHLNILLSLQNTYALLSTTNVNPRLTLENLFLSLEMKHA